MGFWACEYSRQAQVSTWGLPASVGAEGAGAGQRAKANAHATTTPKRAPPTTTSSPSCTDSPACSKGTTFAKAEREARALVLAKSQLASLRLSAARSMGSIDTLKAGAAGSSVGSPKATWR